MIYVLAVSTGMLFFSLFPPAAGMLAVSSLFAAFLVRVVG